MVRSLDEWRRGEATALPRWVKPQLTRLVEERPEGPEWLHEIKFDGYRMHARLDRGAARLLTRTGLDWTHKYPGIAEAVSSLPARQAYLDGELCGVRPDGTTSFSLIQNASDTGNGDALVFFLFDLLHLDGEPVSARPLTERKEGLRALLSEAGSLLQFSDHQIGRGQAFYEQACGLKLEGIISKQAYAPYAPGNRGLWLKVKSLNREEFVVVGWTDPEGARPFVGALLLAYYDPDGRLIYAGRAGTGIGHAELERLWRRLQPLDASPDLSGGFDGEAQLGDLLVPGHGIAIDGRRKAALRAETELIERHVSSDAFDELAELEFTPRLERLGLGVDIERGLIALLRSAYMAGAVAAIAAYNSNLELMRLENSR